MVGCPVMARGYSVVKERGRGWPGAGKKLSPHLEGALAQMMGREMRIFGVFRGFRGGKENVRIVCEVKAVLEMRVGLSQSGAGPGCKSARAAVIKSHSW